MVKTRDHRREYGELAGVSGDVAADAGNLGQVVVTGLHNGGDLGIAVRTAVHGNSAVAHSPCSGDGAAT